MKIEDNFRVEVPVEEAWKVLLDLERIAPCLPGAQLTEVEGDEYRGTVKIKVGPITAQYKGVAKIEQADEANRKVVLQAEGRDTRGQGNASATVIATLVRRRRCRDDRQHRHRPQHHRQGRAVRPGSHGRRVEQAARPVRRQPPARRVERHTLRRCRGRRDADRSGYRAVSTGTGSPVDAGFASTGSPTPVLARSTRTRPSPSTSWTRRAVRSGSGWCRSSPVWSWWWRSARSSSGARGTAASATTPTDPSRIELVFDPAGRGRPAGPGHRPGRVALWVRRGAARRVAVPGRRLRRHPHAPERGAADRASRTLQHEIDALIEEFTPDRARGRAGAVPGEHAHRDDGRSGQRSRARAGRARRHPGGATTAPTR